MVGVGQGRCAFRPKKLPYCPKNKTTTLGIFAVAFDTDKVDRCLTTVPALIW